jgi:hypothetical protein
VSPAGDLTPFQYGLLAFSIAWVLVAATRIAARRVRAWRTRRAARRLAEARNDTDRLNVLYYDAPPRRPRERNEGADQ